MNVKLPNQILIFFWVVVVVVVVVEVIFGWGLSFLLVPSPTNQKTRSKRRP